MGNKKVIGVVGELQFDVLKYRLLHEYGASVDFLALPAYKAFWVIYQNEKDIEDLKRLRYNSLYEDKNRHLVFIAESEYTFHMAVDKNPKARFLSAIEHNDFTVNLPQN